MAALRFVRSRVLLPDSSDKFKFEFGATVVQVVAQFGRDAPFPVRVIELNPAAEE